MIVKREHFLGLCELGVGQFYSSFLAGLCSLAVAVQPHRFPRICSSVLSQGSCKLCKLLVPPPSLLLLGGNFAWIVLFADFALSDSSLFIFSLARLPHPGGAPDSVLCNRMSPGKSKAQLQGPQSCVPDI